MVVFVEGPTLQLPTPLFCMMLLSTPWLLSYYLPFQPGINLTFFCLHFQFQNPWERLGKSHVALWICKNLYLWNTTMSMLSKSLKMIKFSLLSFISFLSIPHKWHIQIFTAFLKPYGTTGLFLKGNKNARNDLSQLPTPPPATPTAIMHLCLGSEEKLSLSKSKVGISTSTLYIHDFLSLSSFHLIKYPFSKHS